MEEGGRGCRRYASLQRVPHVALAAYSTVFVCLGTRGTNRCSLRDSGSHFLDRYGFNFPCYCPYAHIRRVHHPSLSSSTNIEQVVAIQPVFLAAYSTVGAFFLFGHKGNEQMLVEG